VLPEQAFLTACALFWHPTAWPRPEHALSLATSLLKYARHYVRRAAHHLHAMSKAALRMQIEARAKWLLSNCLHMQADDAVFVHRALMLLMGAALKNAALPPGALLQLAERCLPACAASLSTHFRHLCQAVSLLVRRP
jgi:hypothetical protein